MFFLFSYPCLIYIFHRFTNSNSSKNLY